MRIEMEINVNEHAIYNYVLTMKRHEARLI